MTAVSILRVALATAALATSGCILDVAVGEKLCDAAHPCVDGESCQRGRCLAAGQHLGEGEGGEGEGGEGEGAAGEGEGASEGEGAPGEGEGEGEGASSGEGEGEGAAPITLRIDTIETQGCKTASHESSGNGDDRGGIAWGGDALLYVGDVTTLRADVGVLASQSVFNRRIDGLFSDLNDGSVWELCAADGTPFTAGDHSVEAIRALDPDSGDPTGLLVPLSEAVFGLDVGDGRVGMFSGKGKLAIVVDGAARVIDIATGDVTVGPALVTLDGAVPCETWGVWGVLETFDGADHVAWVSTNARIVRKSIVDGSSSVVAQFEDLGDMCCFTVDPTRNLWLFHHEIDSQFQAGSNETIGSCPASLCVDDSCACATGVTSCAGDGCRATDRDPAHCNSCTNACAGANAACVSGQCACSGRFPDACNGDCTDFLTDDAHCGGCGPNTACSAAEKCMNGACIAAPDLHVDAVDTSSCVAHDVSGVAGSQSRSMVVAGATAFYTANNSGVAVSLPALTTNAFTFTTVRAMASDLATGTAYAMLDGGAPVANDLDVIDGIAPISPTDGSLGATIGLASVIDIDNSETIFSGAGRIAVLTAQALNIIDPLTGFVDVEPVPSIPRPNACDQSFGNGVLERHNGDDALLFVPDDGRTISRYDVKTGAHEVVIDFPPGDGACAVSVDKADSLFVVAATNNPPLATSDFGAEQIIACPATLQ